MRPCCSTTGSRRRSTRPSRTCIITSIWRRPMSDTDRHPDATQRRAETLAALAERIYPATDWGPGAHELDLAGDIRRHLATPFGRGEDSYREPPFAARPDRV